jgi:hypothetical protein
MQDHNHNHEQYHDHDESCLVGLEEYFDNKFQEYVDLFDNLITPENFEKIDIPKEIENIKNNVTEDELKVLVIYASVRKVMNNPSGAEIMDVAEYVAEQLEVASLSKPFSIEFIDSIFNFKVIYTILFSLLDLAENGKNRGEKMSADYKMGVIDSIVALRKYQSTSGFGDVFWEKDYNPAANKEF